MEGDIFTFIAHAALATGTGALLRIAAPWIIQDHAESHDVDLEFFMVDRKSGEPVESEIGEFNPRTHTLIASAGILLSSGLFVYSVIKNDPTLFTVAWGIGGASVMHYRLTS